MAPLVSRVSPQAREADLERELRDHLELEAEEQRAAGLSPQEAAYAAHRALGNTLKIEEDVRAAWGSHWFETFVQDVGYAFRTLRKSPGFTAVAMLTLALGIGANTAIFSVIENVLFHPLPYDHPEQLIEVWNTYLPAVPLGGITPGDFQDWRTQATTVSAVGGFSWSESGANLTGDESPARVKINHASANLFPMLGAKPVRRALFSFPPKTAPAARRSSFSLIISGKAVSALIRACLAASSRSTASVTPSWACFPAISAYSIRLICGCPSASTATTH